MLRIAAQTWAPTLALMFLIVIDPIHTAKQLATTVARVIAS